MVVNQGQTDTSLGRVFWRLLVCAGRYVFLFVAGWLVIASTAPRERDPMSVRLGEDTFQATFQEYANLGSLMFAVIGIPSIALVLIAGLVRANAGATQAKMSTPAFRGMCAFLLSLGAWPLVLGNTGNAWILQVLIQVVFAVWLMPVPLVGNASPADGNNARS